VAALLATHNDPAEAARWNLYELWPAPNYAGALAVEAANLVLTCFSFDD
jgi:hypothetical protein